MRTALFQNSSNIPPAGARRTLAGWRWLGGVGLSLLSVAPAAAREEGPPPPVVVAPAPMAPAAPAGKAAPAAPQRAPLIIPTLPSAPAAPAPSIVPPVVPEAAPIPLQQATQGVPGGGGLRATIDVEQGGKPLGTLRCELFADRAPQTVANFVALARGLRPFKDPITEKWARRPFYDGNQFHRVIPDFMIQGGDPQCLVDVNCRGRHGSGDPGYTVPDEISPELRFDRGGRLAMATLGAPNTAGSQFFITERDAPWLNGSHTIFGQCEPIDLIHNLAQVETRAGDVPKVPLRIRRLAISRAGGPAPAAPARPAVARPATPAPAAAGGARPAPPRP